jgi:hypothetical protein
MIIIAEYFLILCFLLKFVINFIYPFDILPKSLNSPSAYYQQSHPIPPSYQK